MGHQLAAALSEAHKQAIQGKNPTYARQRGDRAQGTIGLFRLTPTLCLGLGGIRLVGAGGGS